jgi:hypothetical protein
MSDDKMGFPKHKQYSEPWNRTDKKLTHIAQEKRKKEKEGTRDHQQPQGHIALQQPRQIS